MPESNWPADVYFGDAEKPLPDWRKEAGEESDDESPPTEEERAAVEGILGFDPASLWDDKEEDKKGLLSVKPSPFRNRKKNIPVFLTKASHFATCERTPAGQVDAGACKPTHPGMVGDPESPQPGQVAERRSEESRSRVQTAKERAKQEISNSKQEKIGRVLETWRNLLKELPSKTFQLAKQKVLDHYNKLEARYGRKYALAIIAAGIVGTPIPVPGATAAAVAPVMVLAELHKRLSGVLSVQKNMELAPEEIERLGQEFVDALLMDYQEGEES